MSRSPSAKSTMRTLVVACVLATALSGCTVGQDRLSREDQIAIGTVGGAAIGALVGFELFGGGEARYLAALGLGVAGGYGGALLADRLTEFDKTAMNETAYNALENGPSGATSTWQGTQNGTAGSITPIRTFLDSQGRICREYMAEMSVQGETVSGRETACKAEAGHWVVFASPNRF